MSPRASRWILAGILAGIALALGGVAAFGEAMVRFEFLGAFFLKALKTLIVPLIVASVVVGITGLGDVRALGRVGGWTLAYYAATTAIAVGLGILLVGWIEPGRGVPLGEGTAVPQTMLGEEAMGFRDILLSFLSDNIVQAMAQLDMLPIIVFALAFGAVLTTVGEKARPVIAFFEGLNEAIMKLVHLIMYVTPLGVFGLIAGQFGRAGDLAALIGGLGRYMATVLLGLALHGLVVLPLILWLLGRRNPARYGLGMAPAVLTAFSTASSSATLPLTLECAAERNDVDRKAAYFVLPVGATVNMDGTALYESVAAIFIAQAYGIELSGVEQLLVFVTATLAAVGAAGIPQAGLVTMVIVLRAVGLPLEGIGLILAVDWLLDRFRTAVNVWGDACGAGVIDRLLAQPATQSQRRSRASSTPPQRRRRNASPGSSSDDS